MLNAADHRRNGAWVTVALTLGLRPGEVSGLTWPSLDLDQGRAVVFQSLGWTGKTPALKGTKTGKSRTLDLPPRTVEALRTHRSTQILERLLMGERWASKWSDLVFVTEVGTPINPANLRRMVAEVATVAGIEGHVRPYDLRHSATSLLSAAGVAPELLADLLGHSEYPDGFPALQAPCHADSERRRRPHRPGAWAVGVPQGVPTLAETVDSRTPFTVGFPPERGTKLLVRGPLGVNGGRPWITLFKRRGP